MHYQIRHTPDAPDRNKRFGRLSCCLLAVLLMGWLLIPMGAIAESNPPRVRLFASTEVRGTDIRLGEIAAIEAPNAALQASLEEIIVGAAPLPGQTRNILESHLVMRLRQHSIDPATVELIVPDRIEITRAFEEISPEQIEALLEAYITANVPWEPDRVAISDIRISDAVILPAGMMTCDIIPPARSRWLGTVPFTLVFMVDGQPEKRISATVRIQKNTEVVFTQRPLRRFQVIGAEDLYYRQMDLGNLPSNALMDINEAIGMRTQRSLDANVLLRHDLVEAPPMVNRRDVVRIVYESRTMYISTLGEAREVGRLGERIRVANLASGKEVIARVLDRNTVVVDY